MNKARYIFAASAVTLSAALAANTLFTDQTQNPVSTPSLTSAIPADLKDSEVLTWDCETAEYKPETIMLTCADGGWMVHKITWNTWTKERAMGTAYFSENLCDPSCAEGQRVEAPVKLTLTDLTPYKGKFYFRTLDIRTPGEKDFPWGRAGFLAWDLMEFAEMMKEN